MPRSPPQHRGLRVDRGASQKEYNQKKREGQEFYDSCRWRRLSRWHKKINPLCIVCKELGMITAVQVTDHIISIKNGGDRLDNNNLQSLCNLHHAQKTAEED